MLINLVGKVTEQSAPTKCRFLNHTLECNQLEAYSFLNLSWLHFVAKLKSILS